MWEWTKRVSFSIFSVLSNMESEQDLHTGSDQKVAAPAPQHWPPPEEDRISGPNTTGRVGRHFDDCRHSVSTVSARKGIFS